MNYTEHEELRAEVATVTSNMCDLWATLSGMEHHYRFDSDVLAEHLTRQALLRINALFMAAYSEILELDTCFKD